MKAKGSWIQAIRLLIEAVVQMTTVCFFTALMMASV